MTYIINFIHIIFPLISLLLVIIGIKFKHKNYFIIALWLSLFALVMHYHLAGGEVLGSYFNYSHTLVYSLNLFVLLICIIFLILHLDGKNVFFRYLAGFIGAVSVIGISLLMINLWVNAWFISDRLPGTPIFQIAVFNKLDYCSYRYVFYKISRKGKLKYMCPNYYGLIPAVGSLTTTPDFIWRQLPPSLQKKFQSAQVKQH